jgi:hypothetical protein
MGQLFENIRRLVAEEKYVIGQHASERLEERGTMEWQAVVGLDDGEMIVERPDADPNAVIEVRDYPMERSSRPFGLTCGNPMWLSSSRFTFLTKANVMQIPGQRIKRTRLIQSDKYVVAVEVEMVVPVDDPSEPCYEAETVQLLKDVKDHADRGDLAWLTRRGRVYAAVDAA